MSFVIPKKSELTMPGTILILGRVLGQVVRTLCCWIWNIGNQMHLGRIHHQGVPRRRDFFPKRSHLGISFFHLIALE